MNSKGNHRTPSSPDPASPYSSSDIVHPIKVDESGSFLSYDLSHRALHRRSPSSRSKFLAFYELHYKGQPLKFNLSLNNNLLAPGFVTERRFGGIASAKIQSHTFNSCHMIGEVRSRALQGGPAALSTCDGLVSTDPSSIAQSRSCGKAFLLLKAIAKLPPTAVSRDPHPVGLVQLWMS